MPKYTVVTHDPLNEINLVRVTASGEPFVWGDGTEVQDYIFDYLIGVSNSLSSDQQLLKNRIVLKLFSREVYEFPDDKSALLWFMLEYGG